MTKVFMSYRRADSAGHAGRIYDRLCRIFPRQDVFYDTSTVAPGVRWDEAIRAELQSCKVMLVIIGSQWLTERLHEPDDYVRLEVASALARGIRVIPVLVDGAVMPAQNSLPSDMAALTQWQAHWLNPHSNAGYEADLDRLVDNILPIFRARLSISRLQEALSFNVVPVEIFVDGNSIGKLWFSQSLEYELLEGEHEIYVTMSGQTTAPLKFVIAAGETLRFRTGARTKNLVLTEPFLEIVSTS